MSRSGAVPTQGDPEKTQPRLAQIKMSVEFPSADSPISVFDESRLLSVSDNKVFGPHEAPFGGFGSGFLLSIGA
jgi:hypothetical protein